MLSNERNDERSPAMHVGMPTVASASVATDDDQGAEAGNINSITI